MGTKPITHAPSMRPEKSFVRSRTPRVYHAFLVPLVSLGGFSPTNSSTLRLSAHKFHYNHTNAYHETLQVGFPFNLLHIPRLPSLSGATSAEHQPSSAKSRDFSRNNFAASVLARPRRRYGSLLTISFVSCLEVIKYVPRSGG